MQLHALTSFGSFLSRFLKRWSQKKEQLCPNSEAFQTLKSNYLISTSLEIFSTTTSKLQNKVNFFKAEVSAISHCHSDTTNADLRAHCSDDLKFINPHNFTQTGVRKHKRRKSSANSAAFSSFSQRQKKKVKMQS